MIAEQNEKEKLLFSLNEAMEKLEGEEHTAKVFQDRTSKAKQEIDDLTKSTEEMRETISKLEGTYIISCSFILLIPDFSFFVCTLD